jgi:antitoxin component YwqK of YwqJK toxin-antitoxin module
MIGYIVVYNKKYDTSYSITIDTLCKNNNYSFDMTEEQIHDKTKVKYYAPKYKIINIRNIYTNKNVEYCSDDNQEVYMINEEHLDFRSKVYHDFYLDETLAIHQSIPYEKLLSKISFVGYFRHYNLNGSLSYEFYYNHDRIKGKYIKYYYNSNKIEEITNYIDGKKHGEYIKYDKNENIIEKCCYIDDMIEGIYIIYNMNNITYRFYKNNIKIYECIYTKNNENNDENDKIIEFIKNLFSM